MTKANINILVIIFCIIGAYFSKNETLYGLFLGSLFTSALVLIESTVENWKYLKLLFLCKIIFRNKIIRFSISYLYKIKIDDKYLLVKGKRINQFQPVGGVYKRHPESKIDLNRLMVLDDNSMPIDDESRDDLRIRVLGKNAVELINWFDSEECREVSPFREFCEELILTGIVDKNNFHYIDYSFIRRVRKGIRYSDYFQCHEYLIADIVELRPTIPQKEELKKLTSITNENFIWANEDQIRRRGYNPTVGNNVAISETSEWIL